jgi:hypothetical protein
VKWDTLYGFKLGHRACRISGDFVGRCVEPRRQGRPRCDFYNWNALPHELTAISLNPVPTAASCVMRSRSPSVVPPGAAHDVYLVLDDFAGRIGKPGGRPASRTPISKP